MNKSSWASVLMLHLFLMLAASGVVFAQDEVGRIKKAQGEIYWKQKEGDLEIKLELDKLKDRPVLVGEIFRCGRNGVLVMELYGKEVTLNEKMKEFPIPAALPPKPLKGKPKPEDATRGGKIASDSSLREIQIERGGTVTDYGEQVKKFKGVVVKREADAFTMAETTGGPQTTVILTANTEVKSHKRGALRGPKEYGASYILRGLRLEVDGIRTADGQIVANKVRFDEQDLRTAQALKATIDPLEAELNEKLRQQQAEQERYAGQIEENRSLTSKAQASAEAAAEAARKAQQTADDVNNRINGLDDFEPMKTITIHFATNSDRLSPMAKATIDEAASWVKTQNTKGWVMAVIGYADTTGNSQRNIDLSERRANAVIYYIVSKYKMPLSRLVQPFGYGQLEPVSENKTAAGRAKNRRVEIRLMVNKGISSGAPE